LIVVYLKKETKSPYYTYEIMQILGISIFDKTPVIQSFTKNEKKNNVNKPCNLFKINYL